MKQIRVRDICKPPFVKGKGLIFNVALMEYGDKRVRVDIDKLDELVFKTMLEKEEYRNLPDYYVKEICRKVIVDNLKSILKE